MQTMPFAASTVGFPSDGVPNRDCTLCCESLPYMISVTFLSCVQRKTSRFSSVVPFGAGTDDSGRFDCEEVGERAEKWEAGADRPI